MRTGFAVPGVAEEQVLAARRRDTVVTVVVLALTAAAFAASFGAAVSAVIIYRLATYWLPVLPGWLSWRLPQRREYV